jgi:hypothetical protein
VKRARWIHGLIVRGAHEELALVIEIERCYARFSGFVLGEVGELLANVSNGMEHRGLDSSSTLDGRKDLIISLTFWVLG